MNDVNSVYVLDENQVVIISYENQVENSKDLDSSYFSQFFSAIQMLASEFGKDKEVEEIELGEYRLCASKDHVTNYTFMLNCNKKIKSKKILSILKEIKNRFINIFMGKLNAPPEEKNALIQLYINSLNELFKDQNKLSNFLGAL